MSQRNLTLLIIILVIAVIVISVFLYLRPETAAPEEESPGTNFISRFNPFSGGQPTPPAVTTPADVSGYEPSPEEMAAVKLRKVSSMPVAGFGLFVKERIKNVGEGETTKQAKTEFATNVRYVEKATSNIYQTFADKIEERKFSSTTIPKIHEAYFGNKGEQVIMRYLKGDEIIETFVGALPKEYLGTETTGNVEVKGSFLPQDIKDMAVSSDGLKIFYLFNTGSGAVGTTFNFLDKRKIQVFQSAFTEWLPTWPSARMITLTTKPSANVPGYMYAVNLDNKNFIKILGGINGLTTLTSPNGKLVLYGNNNLSLYVYHTDTRDSNLLGVKTLPEKCVWNKTNDDVYCAVPKLIAGGFYPDNWYQGEISFSDQLWKVDIKNGNATMLVNPIAVLGGEEIDGIKLALDEAENYLFFVNKKDSFLWELNLK